MKDRDGASLHSSLKSSVHSNILREYAKGKVFDKYEVISVLGQGSIGAVSKVHIRPDKLGGSAFQPKKPKGLLGLFAGKNKANQADQAQLQAVSREGDHVFALKSIILSRVSPSFIEEMRNEIDILRVLDHPNIVRAHEVYSSKNQIYLVMELCDGGDLFTRSPYSEHRAGQLTEAIVSAIRYMHENGVVHRDLKFENIMFESKHDDACIKIIDFGLSKKFIAKPGVMTDRVGTIYTMAPQVLQGMYSAEADMWSIGVIAFMLLSASKPFYHRRRRVVIDQIMRGRFKFTAATWDNVSEDAKDFVSKLLVVNPRDRLDAAAALNHSWLVNREELSHEVPTEAVLAKVYDNLVHYRNTSHLKKLALTLVAHKSNKKDIDQLRNVFEKFDTEKDGKLSYDEFRSALISMNFAEEEVATIFESVDVNRNGVIMWTEFVAASLEAHGFVAEDRIAEAFDRIDSDDSGFISKKNLRDFLGEEITAAEIDDIIRSADTNHDGKISYPEFLAAFRSQRYKEVGAVGNSFSASMCSSEGSLLGLDAQIPGGKYDTTE